MIRFLSGHEGGALMVGSMALIREGREREGERETLGEIHLHLSIEERPWEDSARRWPSASREEGSRKKLNPIDLDLFNFHK